MLCFYFWHLRIGVLTRLSKGAFSGCSGLTGVYITDIEKWCKILFENDVANPLYYAHNLYLSNKLVTDFVIPDSITSIGAYAFIGCSGLTSVTIPNSVTSIGYSAFENCSGLTGVYITDIEKWCKISIVNDVSNPLFYAHNLYLNNKLVTNLVIPESVTSIKAYAINSERDFRKTQQKISNNIENSLQMIA